MKKSPANQTAMETEMREAKMTAAAARAGATVIDLSANPYDFSPAINHLVTTVKEARAADQKIIVMLGEEHSTIAHVYMAEMLRQGLKRAGVTEQPVMAVERSYNFFQRCLPVFFSNAGESLYARARQALSALRSADPVRYGRVQAMAAAATDVPNAPATKLSQASVWLADHVDIRFVDLALIKGTYNIDFSDPDTAAFIGKTAETPIHAISPQGMGFRNAWMGTQLRNILKNANVAILQTGYGHVGGKVNHDWSYRESLHALFAKASSDNIRTLTVFSEFREATFENEFPADGQAAMDNADTVILRGGQNMVHVQDTWFGSFENETSTLKRIASATGLPAPVIKNENDYRALLKKNETALRDELHDILRTCGPRSSAPGVRSMP